MTQSPCAVCGAEGTEHCSKSIISSGETLRILLLTIAHCVNCGVQVRQMVDSRYDSFYAPRFAAGETLQALLSAGVPGVIPVSDDDEVAYFMPKYVEGKELRVISDYDDSDFRLHVVYYPNRLAQRANPKNIQAATARIQEMDQIFVEANLGRKLLALVAGSLRRRITRTSRRRCGDHFEASPG